MFLDSNTTRGELEVAAIFECEFDLAVIEKASDAELLAMIQDWIAAGDECGAACFVQ